ncbi:glutamate-1-semialdehyde 2,1-aminomutase [Candidatus Riflebacteria bacterium]
MKKAKSQKAFREACKFFPGGVNSPVRAFKAVGGYPPFINKGRGSKIIDLDGNEYIDYVGSWGPLILGHAHKRVQTAVKNQLQNGLSYGAPTTLETELAKLIQTFFPSIEMMRFVSSGTEATMSAIRVARGHTGRQGIIKIEGAYHGHCDSLLVQAGSGATTFAQPDSQGVLKDFARHTYQAPFNDKEALNKIFAARGKDIAGIILEPVMGNSGLIFPKKGYLTALSRLCKKYKSLLIFDEVMTGFRVAPGGVQEIYKIKPDLTCLGKVVGGGMPLAVFGGKKKIMQSLSPLGGIYQAGTLSGNPCAVRAGIETLKEIAKKGFYTALFEKSMELSQGVSDYIKKISAPLTLHSLGSMFCLFFHPGPIHNYRDVQKCDLEKFSRFFLHMLEQGIYLAPSQFESGFVSGSHSKQDINLTIKAVKKALEKVL